MVPVVSICPGPVGLLARWQNLEAPHEHPRVQTNSRIGFCDACAPYFRGNFGKKFR